MRYALWQAIQWMIAPRCNGSIRRTVRGLLAQLGTGRWLDVGCGPRSLVASALPGTLVGVDCMKEMLRGTRREGVLCTAATATALPFASKSFDGVVSFGMLHHLSDEDAGTALCEMQRVTRPGGIVLVFDSVSPASRTRRPFAALLRALDRGRHVRDEAALRRLVAPRGFELGERVTYSWTGLEGCWAMLVRSV